MNQLRRGGSSPLYGGNRTTVCGRCLLLAAICAGLMAAGCGYTCFQSPRVLRPGETASGLGVGFNALMDTVETGSVEPLYSPWEVSYWWRFGVEDHLDLGVRYLIPSGALIDVKFLALTEPVLVSLDFGVSGALYPAFPDIYSGGHTEAGYVLGVHPTLILGQEHYYLGLRLVHFRTKIPARQRKVTAPGIILGGSIGDTESLIGEMSFSYDAGPSRQHLVSGGIAIEWVKE